MRTLTLTVAAERAAVFNFLADIENFPRWASGYCERLYLQRGGWWALTSEGELMVFLEADARTGVLDLRTGATADTLQFTAIRVVALAPRRTLVSLVLVDEPLPGPDAPGPGLALLHAVVAGLVSRFGSEDVLAPGLAATELAGAGRN